MIAPTMMESDPHSVRRTPDTATASGLVYIEGQFDSATSTISYIVLDRSSGQCALVDTVLDYDSAPATIRHTAADRLMERVRELGATVVWILETHVHADHLSAAAYLKRITGAPMGIGAGIIKVQQLFGKLFHAAGSRADGSPFDRLFADGDEFSIGGLRVAAMHTPGHTPACTSYLVRAAAGDQQAMVEAALVGDTLFMPDYGSARCDFPGGDARLLYRSIEKLLALPPDTVLYTGHDYQPGGRNVRFASTVAEQRANNLHLDEGSGEDGFVAMRQARDATLAVPALMLPSVQINIHGGQLPEPEANGVRYIKIPLDAL